MRRISAVRGMTFGLKYQPRQVFRSSGARDNVARDNEEAVIGTQLWLGISACHTRRLAESEGR
jgi:hypothetical protein